MIGDITPDHYQQILKINQEFVHWLAPMDEARLLYVLSLATYKRQINQAQGILIGYAHDVDYPDHKNLNYLRPRVNNFFYIDRVIIDAASQGLGLGRKLYTDVETFAKQRGYTALACEVNTRPNNPSSHNFHVHMGFVTIGDEDYPEYDASLRYYVKNLS